MLAATGLAAIAANGNDICEDKHMVTVGSNITGGRIVRDAHKHVEGIRGFSGCDQQAMRISVTRSRRDREGLPYRSEEG